MGAWASQETDAEEIETGGPPWVRQSEPSPSMEEHAPPRCSRFEQAPKEASPLTTVRMTLQKEPGVLLGADFGNAAGSGSGAVIMHVDDKGLIRDWNNKNPSEALAPGHIVLEANGACGYFQIIEELGKPGTLELSVQRSALKAGWHDDMACLGGALRRRGEAGAWLRLATPTAPFPAEGQKRYEAAAGAFTCLPSIPAADAGGNATCCICLEDADAEDRIVQLPCKHGFHTACISQWLTRGSKRACPLCAVPVSPDVPERPEEQPPGELRPRAGARPARFPLATPTSAPGSGVVSSAIEM